MTGAGDGSETRRALAASTASVIVASALTDRESSVREATSRRRAIQARAMTTATRATFPISVRPYGVAASAPRSGTSSSAATLPDETTSRRSIRASREYAANARRTCQLNELARATLTR